MKWKEREENGSFSNTNQEQKTQTSKREKITKILINRVINNILYEYVISNFFQTWARVCRDGRNFCAMDNVCYHDIIKTKMPKNNFFLPFSCIFPFALFSVDKIYSLVKKAKNV